MRSDADDLIAIGQLTLDWLKENGLDAHKPVEVFQALLNRSGQYLSEGVSVEDTWFTAGELNAAVKGIGDNEDDSDVAGRYVRNNVAKFQELLDQNAAKVADYLKNKGRSQRVVIASTDPKGRHKKRYFLTLAPLEEPSSQAVSSRSPGVAQYRVRQLPRVRFWVRPFLAIDLVGWRRWLYFGGLLAIIAFGVVLALLAAYQPVVVWKLLVPLSLVALFFMALKPLYDVIDRTIVESPDWMAGLSVPSAHIELRQIGVDADTDRPIRQLRLVVYDGECPLCGGRLDVVEGKGEFKKRLIGECANARAEHLYSFDHVTKRGVPLRNNGYYGELTQ